MEDAINMKCEQDAFLPHVRSAGGAAWGGWSSTEKAPMPMASPLCTLMCTMTDVAPHQCWPFRWPAVSPSCIFTEFATQMLAQENRDLRKFKSAPAYLSSQ